MSKRSVQQPHDAYHRVMVMVLEVGFICLLTSSWSSFAAPGARVPPGKAFLRLCPSRRSPHFSPQSPLFAAVRPDPWLAASALAVLSSNRMNTGERRWTDVDRKSTRLN